METPRTTTSLNDRLNTSYVNLGEENTLRAQYTKFVTGLVGDYIKPRYVFWEILETHYHVLLPSFICMAVCDQFPHNLFCIPLANLSYYNLAFFLNNFGMVL
jgi:hypothetical protein